MKKLLFILLIPTIGFGQHVNIPDANFKACLVMFPPINTNNDGEIQVSEAAAYSGVIACHMRNISDLTGIEAFTAITKLDCSNNLLSSLDVSQNTDLTELWCDSNQLTSLNVSQNTALTDLHCQDNQLSTLNLSGATALTTLRCWNNNQLTTLDVSNNTALTTLYCYNNNLTSLDISQNIALTTLHCKNNNLTSLDVRNGNNTNIIYFKCENNPNLYCINVDDPAWSTSNWTDIDSQHYFSTNCPPSSTQEYSTNKELLKLRDILGRDSKGKKNQPLFYIYDDGTVEKRITVE